MLRRTLASALLALTPLFAHSAVEMLDRVVAVVDQSIVTQTQLNKRIQDITIRMRSANINMPPMDVLKSQVLDQLITETLQLNMADRYGVDVEDAEVLQSIQRILQSKQWSEDQLLASIEAEGITVNEFKENIRRDLRMQHVSQGVVSQRIKISDQEIDSFLKSADAQFWVSPNYRLGHILISVPSSSSLSEINAAEEKAQGLYKTLQEGAQFEEVAIAHSNGPAALKGGDLGWRKSTELPTLFAELVKNLEVGQVSKPTRSQAGFHIIKLNEKQGQSKQIVNQTKARHILLKTSAILNNEQAQEKLVGIRQELLDGADFVEMAKEHSEDIASKLSGGDLGWASPGTFVPQFEETMDKMDINEISQPFQSQFGWHILQVLDRREEDMTDEAIRYRAQNILTQRRFADEVQLWLQELRDEAFIEIKI